MKNKIPWTVLIVVCAFVFSVLFTDLLTSFLIVISVLTAIPAVLVLARLNIFFTIVEEGSAKAILRLGGFERIIMQYKGRRIASGKAVEGNVIEGEEFHPFGGFRWLGIPLIHSLHSYKFRWKTYRPQTGEIKPREQNIDHILVKDDVYIAEIKSAESQGMVPLDITLLLTARCTNPYKSLFRVQDWLEMIISRSEAVFREFVANAPFEELIAKKQQMGGDVYRALGETGLLDVFKNEYGIELRGIEMKDVSPSGENQKLFIEAATKKWLAEKESKSIEVLANAEKTRVQTEYQPIIDFGQAGLIIRYLESIESAGNKQGNWIIPPLDIVAAGRKFFGKDELLTNQFTELLKNTGLTYDDLKEILVKLKGDQK